MKIDWCKIFRHKHIGYFVSAKGSKYKIYHSKCIRCGKQDEMYFHKYFGK